jgi:hypothetical protein
MLSTSCSNTRSLAPNPRSICAEATEDGRLSSTLRAGELEEEVVERGWGGLRSSPKGLELGSPVLCRVLGLSPGPRLRSGLRGGEGSSSKVSLRLRVVTCSSEAVVASRGPLGGRGLGRPGGHSSETRDDEGEL